MTKKDCLKIDSSVFSRPQNDGVFYSGYVGLTVVIIPPNFCYSFAMTVILL